MLVPNLRTLYQVTTGFEIVFAYKMYSPKLGKFFHNNTWYCEAQYRSQKSKNKVIPHM